MVLWVKCLGNSLVIWKNAQIDNIILVTKGTIKVTKVTVIRVEMSLVVKKLLESKVSHSETKNQKITVAIL